MNVPMDDNNKTVAIIYGTRGGLSDVGKFALIHAVQKLPVQNIRVIAMSSQDECLSDTNDNSNNALDIDVNHEREKCLGLLQQVSAKVNIVNVTVDSSDAESKIANVIDGADAVVACIGNRQPSMARWMGLGSQKIASAMSSTNVHRLIILSSMGIGNDFMPMSAVRVFWAAFLRTYNRQAWKDLRSMEHTILNSDLDFLVVRPTGVDPNAQRKDTWEILASEDDKKSKKIDITISKSDVAMFMLEEAISPTFHRTAVTIGQRVEC